MRNAALVLGILGGVLGMVVGFFVYGYIELSGRVPEVSEVFGSVEDPDFLRLVAVLAPLLAIAGGAMARARALWGGVLLLMATGGLYAGLGLGVFTIFPIALCGLAGLLAVAAGRPDEEKAHF
ncbi:MAG: hypothetical protein AAFN09_12270 [Pseudomonadota bacterium]